jgi:ribosomal protein L11 methyltransferase
MRNYLHIKLSPLSKEQQEVLIAQLSEQGFEGFEEGDNWLSAFIPDDEVDEEAFAGLLDESVTMSREIIAAKNWNEEWEKNFEPVVIGSFCAIRAHFHAPVATVQHEIVITPKMSFGTGHHATTSLMISAMETTGMVGKTVLDFGTGTGVLAILAEKMGAGNIIAIDNDDWSIENAAENIAVNTCKHIELYKADTLTLTRLFDIILANINRHVLLANMGSFKQHLTPGGVLLMSGLLYGDREIIETEALKHDLHLVKQERQKDWIMLLFK